MTRQAQSGATLIELIVAIVVITMAASTIIGLLAFISRSSAEAMVQAQSSSVANAYLERILADSFGDIDGHIVAAGSPIRDAYDNAIVGLEDYTIEVSVSEPTLAPFPAGEVKLVEVRVTSPLGEDVVLSGFRANRP